MLNLTAPVRELAMRLMSFAAALFFATPALAVESGLYYFTFTPDNQAAPFTLCFDLASEGEGGSTYQDIGKVFGQLQGPTGPYGQPMAGMYDVTNTMNFDLYMYPSTQPNQQYTYYLTSVLKNYQIAKTRQPRYTIAISVAPPPFGPKQTAMRPGGYTIVDTGTFSVAFHQGPSCS
jgi:hypothetical protein